MQLLLGGIVTWSIETDRGEVDLGDASVLEIVRSNNDMRVSLDFARIWRHDERTGWSSERIDKPSLLFQRVARERALRYVGEGVEGDHPDPTRPLDLIEVVKYTAGKLELQGYLGREPWYVWEVEAAKLAVHWGNNVANAT